MALPQELLCSYADLLSWEEDTRYELYNGVPIALASPMRIHQSISGEIFLQLATYLRGKKCQVFYAPLDVRLFEKEGDSPKNVDTVVQPDLMVVCDPKKLDNRSVRGAPDMVVEILSTSTLRLDRLVKFNLYLRAGVREYWIVDPAARTVSVYMLKDGAYHSTDYGADASIPVGILEDCRIDMTAVFPEAQQ